MRLLVFGGNGFVGSHVVQEMRHRGIDVVVLSRSGAPSGMKRTDVQYVKGDLMKPDTWQHLLPTVQGVVSCVGAFGSNTYMKNINGVANAAAAELAAKNGVQTFTYVSAQQYKLPHWFLPGYFGGKQEAETAVLTNFPDGKGVVLRPSMVYGQRGILPLQYIGVPWKSVADLFKSWHALKAYPILDLLLIPPVSVQNVARAVADAAEQKVGGKCILDVEDIAAR